MTDDELEDRLAAIEDRLDRLTARLRVYLAERDLRQAG